MRIIALEGLDKSGKHTQTLMLTDYLKSLGYRVEMDEFPRYDTETGKLLRKYLYNEWDVDSFTFELLMAADKQAQQKRFKELESDGIDFLIIDRYIGTQVCYSIASGLETPIVDVLQRKLIKPDLEIFIDITAEMSLIRKGQHGVNDRFESDLDLLTKVRNSFLDYFSSNPNRVKISGLNNEGVDVLSLSIQKEVVSRLGIRDTAKV